MQVEAGSIFVGKVTGLTGFGAFVSFGDGLTGMVHISEVASTYVKDIKDHLAENQEVKVKVLTVNPDGKISLSIKKAMEPAEERKPMRQQRSGGRERRSSAPVWQGVKQTPSEGLSFEDMLSKFKQVSDEKMTALKKASEAKGGSGGFSRRGGRQ